MTTKNDHKSAAAILIAGIIFTGCATQTPIMTPNVANTLRDPRFDFYVLNYPSTSSDSSEGKFYDRVRYDDLIFIKSDSSYTAHYQLSVNLFLDKGKTESRYSRTFDRKISVLRYSQTLSNRNYDETSDKIIVNPGDYVVELRLLDLNTNVTSSREFEYHFKDFFLDSINISDIMVFDSLDSTPVHSVGSRVAFAGIYLTAKVIPRNIPLHLVAKSTEAPTSIDTVYELKQTSSVQYYRLPLNLVELDVAAYDLRISAGNDFAETAFRILPDKSFPGSTESDIETGPLVYIMTRQQFDSLKTAGREGREKFLREFWLKRSHGDTAVSAALQKEFHRRAQAADDQFGSAAVSGWRSDRGRIYILYGKPDRVENHASDLTIGPAAASPPYEVWYYTSPKLRFVFVDEFRNGNYRLIKSGGA